MKSINSYQTIEKIIHFVVTNYPKQLNLAQIARQFDLSQFDLQKIFTQWAGISPEEFLQYLSKEHALQSLKKAKNNLDNSFDANLSSSSHLHNLKINFAAISAKKNKSLSKRIQIYYAYGPTLFANVLIAWTDQGICHLTFSEDFKQQLALLKSEWVEAEFIEDKVKGIQLLDSIFYHKKTNSKINLVLKGTDFELKVWQALIQLKPDSLVSYADIARFIDNPKAARAVGSALAKNKIAYLIPCHQVILQDGKFGNYRWGRQRKLAMIAWQFAQTK